MQRYSVQQLQDARNALADVLAQEEQIDFAVVELCPGFTGLIVRTLRKQMQFVPEQSNGVPVVTYPQKKVIHLDFRR